MTAPMNEMDRIIFDQSRQDVRDLLDRWYRNGTLAALEEINCKVLYFGVWDKNGAFTSKAGDVDRMATFQLHTHEGIFNEH